MFDLDDPRKTSNEEVNTLGWDGAQLSLTLGISIWITVG